MNDVTSLPGDFENLFLKISSAFHVLSYLPCQLHSLIFGCSALVYIC